MPWYKTGTVKTTNNSNAIIGTGTAFIANSRVGDAFRGPDGAWYEVTNIASDTAMSITPNYQGPTVAAGGYALAPMQGYVKDLADQARAIIQQWGATLAGLGSVSTENVVPVTKGGTGSTTVASARNTFGLGVGQVPYFASLELTATIPYIDFHYGNSPGDYDVRLLNDAAGRLSCTGYFAPAGIFGRAGVAGQMATTKYNFNWNGGALETWIDATNVGNVSLITSDYRIKRNIETFNTSFLDRIDSYRIVTYRKKDFSVWRDDGRLHQGLIAHEVQAVNPLATIGDKDSVAEDDEPLIQQLDPMALITDLMGAIKELRAEVNNLKSRLS